MKVFKNLSIFILSSVIMFIAIEGLYRLKNSDMKNYNIEMWRYSNELKKLSENKTLGHEHLTSKEAILQGVNIRLNNFGLRGDDINQASTKRRILLLGSSITLGWGIDENETMSHLLDDCTGPDIEVLNAGIGNYNTVRYTELFLKKLHVLQPTDIIINYALNDSEILHDTPGNWFLKNSEIAVSLWNLYNRVYYANFSLENYYETLYDKNFEGYQRMLESLDKLQIYAEKNRINVFLAITPDMHLLENYTIGYIHDLMQKVSKERGFIYIDLLEAFHNIEDSRQYWVMPTDPHPNVSAHRLMANELCKHIK